MALARDLRSGRWGEGEKLPTERELGVQYGVARNTVRRAPKALEAEGLILRHAGRGTFRAPSSLSANPFEVDPEALSSAEVMECRLMFEPALGSLAVLRATQTDFDRLDACLGGAEDARDVSGFEYWDAKLHDTIAAATRNHTIIAIARALALARARLKTEWSRLKARSMTPEHRIMLHAQHRAIVDALRHRDRDETQKLLCGHILYVRGRLFGA
ncbi:MAG TPA: GntR family transcriptional regulator [Rhodopila sp.]|nr:GntR family transcriptional regulator [Rhodopila sp.]